MYLTNGSKNKKTKIEMLLMIVSQNSETSSGERSLLIEILYFLLIFSFNGLGIALCLKQDLVNLSQALTFS